MSSTKLIAAALISLATVSTALAGQDVAAPQDVPFKVEKAQLAIKSPGVNVCPANARMSGWIFTNKAGPVTYMIVRKGGQVGAPQTIQAIKGPAGYVASFTNTFEIQNAIAAEYRILVSNSGGIVSNWAPLKASCKIQLGG
ncbi:MAG: hypothetical protein H6878_07940 [Rhodobiaceae bacterium]|nr:hypothetical protein [Rhodobiaceae bacterium]MCC0016186.1 hypothetical protein [Rhodobiaceae bacterium]MCC0041209.1 hypothetical protein [Rhodobiaceae bacterium]